MANPIPGDFIPGEALPGDDSSAENLYTGPLPGEFVPGEVIPGPSRGFPGGGPTRTIQVRVTMISAARPTQ